MFTPQGRTTRSRASPFTPSVQTPRSQNRRVSNLFTPKGRTPSHLNSSVQQHGNKSLHTSQLIEETEGCRVETYGLQLPVLITEALTQTDRHTEITVKVDPSGWAWLVGGRKLFVWKYKNAKAGRSVFCKELTLPPSDLAHDAERVCVISSESDNQSASCMAVSPEGVVRYWSNIAYEGSSVEVSAELKGDECACVINFSPFGCILATTTSSLVLLTPVPGQNTVVCHAMKGAQGMFSGIGRRMSSLIFGAMTTGAPLLSIVCGQKEDDERPFYVLSGTHLQKWNVTESSTEKLLYQVDVDRMFRESIAKKIWDQDSRSLTQLKTWLLDMQPTENGVVILAAGVNMDVSMDLYFALAFLNLDICGTPSALESLMVLEHKERYTEEYEYQLQSFKLLLPDQASVKSYVYNKNTIMFVTGPSADVVNLQAPGGNILGVGISDSVGVFFSGSVGLFTIATAQDKQAYSALEEPTQDFTSADLSVLTASAAQVHELSMSEDKTTRLKAAFIDAMKGNVDAAKGSVDEMFPPGTDMTSDLDITVYRLDKDLIDDYPASDPRWAESRQGQDITARSTNSLIIINQLNDKLKAHEYVINFLKNMALWERLTTVPVRDIKMLSHNALCEHAEKVQAATALKQLHSEYPGIIDAAIRRVLERRGCHSIQSLTSQDLFFREVSRIHEVVECLLEHEEEVLVSASSTTEVLAVVTSVNAVFEGMFHKALQHRQSKTQMYDPGTQATECPEYIPWTSTSGDKGARTILLKQYNKTLEKALPEVRDSSTSDVLYQQMVSLADIILDGYSCQLESLRRDITDHGHCLELQRRYEQDRQNLILPLLEGRQYEHAAALAEKYLDFEILIRICEVTDNPDRIEKYLAQFADKGFSDFLYNWYMKEGKRGKLMSLPVRQQQELGGFLQTDSLRYLSWLHDIQTKNFSQAHLTLYELGRMEQLSLAKKKTLLSLSKLAALASEEPVENLEAKITGINEEQDLIVHQEQLPPQVIENLGMEPDNMRVLTPIQIIEQYISGTNIDATEYDFRKALDLLQYIDRSDPNIDYEALRMHIWTQCILRDSWTIEETVDPQELNKDTVFFKTVDLAYRDGLDLRTFLPDLNILLQSNELGLLKGDKNFEYLIRAGYEHIQQILL
ncbi:hypothetical protein FSP39_007562 [Pinctada imbricata]|uniref:Nuclear pore complex protein Nup133 n=1 Tax=Pinctada imbricata TaxID=66713 RepID=A0AA88YAR4_PINIB|nr:hypothetical protein FSP39_007562 [Pinctada imbricata]